MTAVLSVGEDVSGLGQHRVRDRHVRRLNAPLGSEKVDFAPVLPRLQRFPVDVGGKAHAEPLVEMDADDRHARAAREERSILPQGAVGRIVLVADFQRFDVDGPR